MSAVIDDTLLGDLVPVKELGPDHRARLAASARVETIEAGNKLAATKEQDWLIYILEGELGVASVGRSAGKIEASSPRAKLPLFSERASNDFAIAEKSSTILRIDKRLFAELLNTENLAGYQVVSDLDVGEAESAVFSQVYEAYQSKQLELPPMPEVALRLRRMADDPDVGIPEIAKVVQTDPAVAGAIMHAANSPLFCSSKTVGTLKDAVVRLGLKTTRSLATSISMRASFKADQPEIKARAKELWEHSVNVSALSYVIARRAGKSFDPERALLAGLLHDIGTIPILSFICKAGLKPSAQELEHIIQKLHAMVGVLVLNYWDFDPELVSVAEEADHWQRDADAQADYCDIVIVAQLLTYAGTERAARLPAPQDVPAFAKLGLTTDDEGAVKLLSEAAGEIENLRALLNA
jgi:putative nucleotidyltransferase with HDIG domain